MSERDDKLVTVIARPKAVAISSKRAEELEIATAAASSCDDGLCHLKRLSFMMRGAKLLGLVITGCIT